MRTVDEIIQYYVHERGKDLEYVRRIAQARNNNDLRQAVDALLEADIVEVECELIEEVA